MSRPGGAVVGVLLAGGRSKRMGGGDKFLHRLGGRPLIECVLERVRPQVDAMVINAGGDAHRFDAYGLPVVGDVIADFAGPLAGILTGLEWAVAEHPDAAWLASFASDAPFVPEDLVATMRTAVTAQGGDIACAVSGGRTHPVCGLWPLGLAGALRRAMVDDEMRKIDRWTARYRVVHVEFPVADVDPFFNVNRPEDLAEAERLLARRRVSA
jgi:molybdopterin-guanine dinucleotide biosynthesis protein A